MRRRRQEPRLWGPQPRPARLAGCGREGPRLSEGRHLVLVLLIKVTCSADTSANQVGLSDRDSTATENHKKGVGKELKHWPRESMKHRNLPHGPTHKGKSASMTRKYWCGMRAFGHVLMMTCSETRTTAEKSEVLSDHLVQNH